MHVADRVAPLPCRQYFLPLPLKFSPLLPPLPPGKLRALIINDMNIIYPALFNFFTSTFPQSDNLLANSYAEDFTVSCSNSNVAQMAEVHTANASNIEEWADEQGLAISAPKSTITVFIPQFTQSNTHSVTLNNSLLPLERIPRI